MKRLKEMTEFVFAVFYALFLRISGKKPRRIVLYYHGVHEADVAGFKKQMAYLSKNCSVIEASKIRTANVNGANILVAITFDDAFENVRENAVPILREYGLPAGIFVPVSNLGQPPKWQMAGDCLDRNETIMSKEDIIELDKDGYEIFSHTLSHPRLTEIDDNCLNAELAGSKQALEEILGHTVQGISYPHGAHDARVREAACKAGYEIGFTIEPTVVDNTVDQLQINRFSVSPRESLIKFRLKVSGAYQVVCHLRALRRLFVSAQ